LSVLARFPADEWNSCRDASKRLPLHRQNSALFRGFSSSSKSAGEQNLDTVSTNGPVTKQLQALIDSGSVQPDPHQHRAAVELDRLYHDLMAAPPPEEKSTSSSSETEGFWTSILGGVSESLPEIASSSSAKGIYTYGGVGCGKTFLMELFFKALDKEPRWQHDKQMIHYHKFMLNVHQFMHTSKQKHGNDHHPIDAVVQHILQSGKLLCLDEFQVTDVADAMILKELFGKLWKKDCVLVTTSNRPPRDLYLNGLQRDRFLPFVDLLEDRCNVVSLVESETDYRMVISAMDKNENDDDEISDHSNEDDKSEALISTDALPPTPKRHQVYFCGQDQQEVLQKLFYEKAKGAPTNPSTLETQGRTVHIPMACTSKSICMFSFEDICQKALGAADYLVIGQNFSTLYVYGIPTMTVNEINWLRRFITLVDSMYECKVRLVLQTAANSVEEIFTVEDKESYQQDEVFAFD